MSPQTRIQNLLCCVDQHLKKAQLKHKPLRCAHEGYAVILEELDELWDCVKKDDAEGAALEAFHVAAVALRFVFDLYEHQNQSPPTQKGVLNVHNHRN